MAFATRPRDIVLPKHPSCPNVSQDLVVESSSEVPLHHTCHSGPTRLHQDVCTCCTESSAGWSMGARSMLSSPRDSSAASNTCSSPTQIVPQKTYWSLLLLCATQHGPHRPKAKNSPAAQPRSPSNHAQSREPTCPSGCAPVRRATSLSCMSTRCVSIDARAVVDNEPWFVLCDLRVDESRVRHGHHPKQH